VGTQVSKEWERERERQGVFSWFTGNTVFVEQNKVEDDLIGKAEVETDTDDLV